MSSARATAMRIAHASFLPFDGDLKDGKMQFLDNDVEYADSRSIANSLFSLVR